MDYNEQYVHDMSSAFYSSLIIHSDVFYVIENLTISNSYGLGSYLYIAKNDMLAMQFTNVTLFNNTDGGLIIVAVTSNPSTGANPGGGHGGQKTPLQESY